MEDDATAKALVAAPGAGIRLVVGDGSVIGTGQVCW